MGKPWNMKTPDEKIAANAYKAKWRAARRDQERANAARRRRENPEAFRAADVAACLLMQGSRCFYCIAPLTNGYEVDHMTPLSRGGSNGAENIVCACKSCNRRKHNKTAAEFNLIMRAA